MVLSLPRKVYRKIKSWVRSWSQQRKAKNIARFSEELACFDPVIVLGNQKTGSTAIASLLAQASKQSVTLDLQKAIPDVSWQLLVKYNITEFEAVAYKYSEDFFRTIIKEPSLTFFYNEMLSLMPNAKFVFIQRNPYQNIRSILNRLNIPGNLRDIDYEDWPELQKTPMWRLTLDSSWLGRPKGSYIEGLAHRWDLAARTYLESVDDFVLIRYEDFVMNKKAEIEGLVSKLGMVVRQDIDALVDVQHQPKGNAELSPLEFFGETNLKIIRDICGDNARQLGYEL